MLGLFLFANDIIYLIMWWPQLAFTCHPHASGFTILIYTPCHANMECAYKIDTK